MDEIAVVAVAVFTVGFVLYGVFHVGGNSRELGKATSYGTGTASGQIPLANTDSKADPCQRHPAK